LKEIIVVQVSCSFGEKYCHSGCVDADGNVYTWGSGYKGKLGHEALWTHADPADEPVPKKVYFFKEKKAKLIACGTNHNLVIGVDGEIYSFGCGSDGRLGHPESDAHIYLYREGFPRAIDTLKGQQVIQASAAQYHNICLVVAKMT
jgi:alpha-tubulin suppressor-like RCC1 family protein